MHNTYDTAGILSLLCHYIILYQYFILLLTVIWKQTLNVQMYDDIQFIFILYITIG